MVSVSQKQLGLILIAFSLILIVLLTWVKINLDKQGVFLCKAVEDNPALKMEDCPVHNSNTSLLIMGAFGIAALLFGSGIYLFISRTGLAGPVANIDPADLDKQEQQLYALLKEHRGSMYQSEMIKATGMSKVQVTRILDRMAGKYIIDRQRRGMTNVVVLR